MKRIALCAVSVIAVSISALAQGGRGAPAPPPPLEPGASQADSALSRIRWLHVIRL